MSKRVADNYITDQNWDREDPPSNESDEKEGFRKATDDILKNRVIRKAKRRAIPGQQAGMSAFSGFSGLKAPSNAVTTGATPFSCFAKNSSYSNAMNTSNTERSQVANQPLVKSSDEEETSQKSDYNTHLSALNRSVSNWIKSHVEKNPLCDLTPIFNDYKKHLADIDEKYGHSDTEGSQASKSDSQDMKDSQEGATSPSKIALPFDVSIKTNFSLTGFGQKSGDSQEKNNTIASMEGSKLPSTQPKFTGFPVNTGGSPFKGFGHSNLSKPTGFTGFSFSSSMVASKDSSQQPAKAGEEEYDPPKPESNVVEEEDAFYSIRCKLYYKKGDAYADRGVGQLYLKPSGSKTQLLIRADTAISQVLLNILISSATPIQRQGKNNVMVMCIPNPVIDEKEKDKVVAMLIRVKTGDDADKLLTILEQKKADAAKS